MGAHQLGGQLPHPPAQRSARHAGWSATRVRPGRLQPPHRALSKMVLRGLRTRAAPGRFPQRTRQPAAASREWSTGHYRGDTKTSVRGGEPSHFHHTGGLRRDQDPQVLTTLVINTPKGCPVIPGGSARGVRCGASQGGGASSYWAYSDVPTTRRGAVAVVARPPGVTGQPLAGSVRATHDAR